MPGSDWSRHASFAVNLFGLGAFLLLVACVTAIVLGRWADVHEGYAAYQKNAEQDQRAAAEKAAEICRGRQADSLLICIADEIEAAYKKQASNKDLQAQQDMALWASWQAVAAFFSAIASVGTVFFAWRAVKWARVAAEAGHEMVAQARATTNAAVLAATHATASVEHAREANDIARAQIAAHVTISEVVLTFARDLPSLEFNLCNAGHSAALRTEVWASFGYEIGTFPTDCDRSSSAGFSRGTLRQSPEGEGHKLHLGRKVSIPEGTPPGQRVAFFVVVTVSYLDIFRRRQTEEYELSAIVGHPLPERTHVFEFDKSVRSWAKK